MVGIIVDSIKFMLINSMKKLFKKGYVIEFESTHILYGIRTIPISNKIINGIFNFLLIDNTPNVTNIVNIDIELAIFSFPTRNIDIFVDVDVCKASKIFNKIEFINMNDNPINKVNNAVNNNVPTKECVNPRWFEK